MRLIAKFFFCLIFCFSLSSSYSQQTGFSTKLISFPDTSFLNSSDTFSVWVKNLNTTPYSGFVNVYISADTVAFSIASLCSLSTTIAPFDSVFISCNITFDSTYFNAGNNIVVVWSSGNAVAPADSAWDKVYLKTTGMAVNEHQHEFLFSLYPSFANSFLYIDFQKTNLLPEKIRILDVSGREINLIPILKQEKKKSIDISCLSHGVYFIEVYAGNYRSKRKFIKAN